MKAVLLIDDIDHANGIRTEADGTYRLSWDGLTVELDLTKQHAREIENLIAHLFRVGTIVGRSEQGKGSRKVTRSYNAGMRAWADANGISYRQAGTGKVSYSADLKKRYAEYLVSRG
jgi:hypothetical protein